MESLPPDAQEYLEALREDPISGHKRRSLDYWHGQWRAFANDPQLSVKARACYAARARAVEIRLRELELEALLDS